MDLILYGIRTCDLVAAARRWLEGRGARVRMHDYRADGLEPQRLQSWILEVGIDRLLNTKSAAYRKLDPAQRALLSEGRAIEVMMGDLLLIKRPVLEGAGSLLVGFSPADYDRALSAMPGQG